MQRLRCWLAAALLALACQPAIAAVQCEDADARGVRLCTVGLGPNAAAALWQAQQRRDWCWAASIAMALEHLGVRVAQAALATLAWGRPDDRTADLATMQMVIGRRWALRHGESVTTRAVPLGSSGSAREALAQAREALIKGEVVLLGARRHAVLLTSLVYEEYTQEGAWRVRGGAVLDPLSTSGPRALLPEEMTPDFLAAVVRAADEP